MENCLFCKIVAGEIPSQKVFEDDEILAFNDISPAAQIHILVIPKKHIASLFAAQDSDSEMLGRLLIKAQKIAKEKSAGGFRLIANTEKIGGQEVPHLHFHILGGEKPIGKMVSND